MENIINLGVEMKRKDTTIEEAREAYYSLEDNQVLKIFYPTFEDYWKDCEDVNNLPDDKWHKLIERNQRKLNKYRSIK